MDHQTFAQLLGNYGEFIGAIAVVGTLLYLAVQVRQSREALRANTRALDDAQKQARVNALREIAFNWNGVVREAMGSRDGASIFLRGCRDIEDLDEVEEQIFVTQLVPFFNQSLVVTQMAQEGLLSKEIIGDDIAELLDGLVGDLLRSNPGVQVVWRAMAHNWPNKNHIDALLERDGEPGRYAIGQALPRMAHTVG